MTWITRELTDAWIFFKHRKEAIEIFSVLSNTSMGAEVPTTHPQIADMRAKPFLTVMEWAIEHGLAVKGSKGYALTRVGRVFYLAKRRLERILCASVWVDTGVEECRTSYGYPATGLVFSGYRHSECLAILARWRDALSEEQRAKISPEHLAGRCQGFTTSAGRFVNRADACDIAHAAGQTDKFCQDLYSEDVW